MGGSLIDLCTLLQQVGRCVAPVPVLANLGYGALAVQRFGTDEQKKRLLPGVADGSLLLTGALEEDHNDEPLKPVCDAIAEGAGYLISGQKLNVPLADEASRIVVACSDEDGRPVLLLLDPGARGLELTLSETPARDSAG